MVLSITSATRLSSFPKYNLLPILIFLAGSTKTSHNLCSEFNSRSKNTSILAPVFSLLPNKRAGKTLVLLRIITSFSSKYSIRSLKYLCSIVCFSLLSTINLASSRCSEGYSARSSSGNSKLKWDSFMKIIFTSCKYTINK